MRSVADEPTPQTIDTTPAEAEERSGFKRAQKTYALVSDILTPQRIGLFLAFALLLGIGLFGGWDAAVTEVDDVPRGEPSATAAVPPFDVVFRRARYGDSLEPAFRPQEGVRYWFVSLDVTNTTNLPVDRFTLTDDIAIDLPGLKSFPGVPPRPTPYRLLDSLTQGDFQPGLTTQIALVWEQDAAAAIPDEVTLTVPKYTWRASSMDGSTGWRDAEPGLIITLPADPLGAG